MRVLRGRSIHVRPASLDEVSLMKRIFAAMTAALLVLAFAGAASAAAPSKLRVELGQNVDSHYGDAAATITGPRSVTLEVGLTPGDWGSYAAVYVNAKAPFGKLLSAVDFGFASTGPSISGGAPRLSIPVDSEDAGSGWDLFAFIDVNSCAGSGFVSTTSATCGVYIGAEYFANWDALAAAHSNWRMASDTMPFAIADQPGTYDLWNIDLN